MDIFSIIVFVVCVLVVRAKVFNGYFVERQLNPIQRFLISFLLGIMIVIVVNVVGLLIAILELVGGDDYFNIFSTTLTLTGLSTRDIASKISSFLKSSN